MLLPVIVCKVNRCPESASPTFAVRRRSQVFFGWLNKRTACILGVLKFSRLVFYTQLSLSQGITTHKRISPYIRRVGLTSWWSRPWQLDLGWYGLIFPTGLGIGGLSDILLPRLCLYPEPAVSDMQAVYILNPEEMLVLINRRETHNLTCMSSLMISSTLDQNLCSRIFPLVLSV